MIRRLTAQHPERNGREAELWDHPSNLAGPAVLHSGVEERQGDSCEVEECRQAKGQAARPSSALTYSVTLSESLLP